MYSFPGTVPFILKNHQDVVEDVWLCRYWQGGEHGLNLQSDYGRSNSDVYKSLVHHESQITIFKKIVKLSGYVKCHVKISLAHPFFAS